MGFVMQEVGNWSVINLSSDGDPRFDFNTGWIFKRYGGKGVPYDDLEEAIYDGVSEAFVRLEPGREDSFCGCPIARYSWFLIRSPPSNKSKPSPM